MPDRPTYRPVYKALHRPLTIWGVDRRLFFLSLLLGAATFNLFYSFLAGLLMAGGLYGFALWATARDPEMLRILLASSKARRRYDPGRHDRVDVEVTRRWVAKMEELGMDYEYIEVPGGTHFSAGRDNIAAVFEFLSEQRR